MELVQQVKTFDDFDSPFNIIKSFEQALADYTGAPYAVAVDHCSHAIEMCMLAEGVKQCSFPAYTYLSVPMTMVKLGIEIHIVRQKVESKLSIFGYKNLGLCSRITTQHVPT